VAASLVHLQELVLAALAARQLRVQMLDLPDGQRFWVKRQERLHWRLRLQKGDPRKAFDAERHGLQVLADAGLPVAKIVLQGPDYLVLPDAGRTLHAFQRDPSVSIDELRRAFAGGALSLARLLQSGFMHGRPAVRDICWDGRTARFIDLERFRMDRRGAYYQAMDVVMFVQTIATVRHEFPERGAVAMDAALTTYRAHGPEPTLHALRRMIPWLRPLGVLASVAAWIRPSSRELRAVGLALENLRKLVA
jgi:hypothetical protein